jgi:hypothetical protein
MGNSLLGRFAVATLLGTLLVVSVGVMAIPASASPPQVLRVGRFHGIKGQFTSIQAAVNAAHPGDWILVAPGDYHETGAPDAGVLITTPGIHLRGMDRNRVMVDGTRPGFGACSSVPAAQNVGAEGRNGVEVFKVDNVSIENLTVCNFLAGPNDNGNEIWFNGGDGSGVIGMGTFTGAYLNATSTFFQEGTSSLAMYGIFASNSSGPGLIDHTYSSNMADSSYYVGACPDCNTTLRFAHAENSALGYSGTNAGGHLVIEYSVFDRNRSGIGPNSLNNSDAPSPQNGACPSDPSMSCTLIQFNVVHDNNNANVPALGITATTPIGTGIFVSGGQNDVVRNNLVYHQGAWGVLLVDFADTETPPPIANCNGGIPDFPSPFGPACYFVTFGNRVAGNLFSGNGYFGNPGNVDLADATLSPAGLGIPGTDNCFTGNFEVQKGAPSSDPAAIQSPSVLGTCGSTGHGGDMGGLLNQVTCAALGLCPDGGNYPQTTAVRMLPLPDDLASMPNPCFGVPSNPWCGNRDEG